MLYPKLIEDSLLRFWDCNRKADTENTWQLTVPIIHEDGDWISIFAFILPGDDTFLYVTDRGNTMFRLSFSADLDDPGIMYKAGQIARSAGVQMNAGCLEHKIDVRAQPIEREVMRVTSASLRILARQWWI